MFIVVAHLCQLICAPSYVTRASFHVPCFRFSFAFWTCSLNIVDKYSSRVLDLLRVFLEIYHYGSEMAEYRTLVA